MFIQQLNNEVVEIENYVANGYFEEGFGQVLDEEALDLLGRSKTGSKYGYFGVENREQISYLERLAQDKDVKFEEKYGHLED
jgi:hypothetical protein